MQLCPERNQSGKAQIGPCAARPGWGWRRAVQGSIGSIFGCLRKRTNAPLVPVAWLAEWRLSILHPWSRLLSTRMQPSVPPETFPDSAASTYVPVLSRSGFPAYATTTSLFIPSRLLCFYIVVVSCLPACFVRPSSFVVSVIRWSRPSPVVRFVLFSWRLVAVAGGSAVISLL